MNLSKRQRNITLILIGSLLVLLGGVFAYGMSIRDSYLDKAVTKAKAKLKDKYALNFMVASYRFDGLTTVVFDDVLVIPEGLDTLAQMKHFGVGVKVLPLLFGDVELSNFSLNEGSISFVKRDSLSNYDFLFKKNTLDSTVVEEPNERNFAEWAERIAKSVFTKIPDDLEVRNFEVSYKDDALHQRVRVPEAIINGGDFETSLFLNDNDAEWRLKGFVDGGSQRLKVEVSSRDKDTEVPFIKGKYGLGVSFDKLVFDLVGIRRVKKNLLHVDGSFSYDNLVVNHRRLSDSAVVLPHALAEGGIEIANDYVAVKENSTIRVADFVMSPNIKYTIKPNRIVSLSIHTGFFQAQTFFDAIPKGLFENLEGVEVEGAVAYNLDFEADLDKPDSVKFESSIDDEDLKVVKWGRANIDSLNTAFEYDAYTDTVLTRRIIVGPINPNFVPLDQIPYVLKTTVRNTEDPFFYEHNGFEEEAFKLSIATNLKEKKFKRGASTISMQLVKNVFLNRKKTMNRKFEEILLVWLMEASGAVSKDRMFEIYLNVIEWGKNVYGISEAANYYFNKKASELNLGESLYLSSIIPRPKTGLSSFDHTGHLKPWVQRHFNTYGYIMNKVGDLKNVSVPANYGFYDVVLRAGLRPAAPRFIDTTASSIVDEAYNDDEIEPVLRKSVLDILNKKEEE